MTYYWLYCRLNVHCGASDDDVRQAFANYADAHIKGGRGALAPEHYAGILSEHHDAQSLYVSVQTGRF